MKKMVRNKILSMFCKINNFYLYVEILFVWTRLQYSLMYNNNNMTMMEDIENDDDDDVTIEVTTEAVTVAENEEDGEDEELFLENTDDTALVSSPPPAPVLLYHTFLTPVFTPVIYNRYPLQYYYHPYPIPPRYYYY